MKATFFKRFRKVFASILIILTGYLAWACADGYLSDGEDSNFAPEAFADSSYAPFFYSQMFYYDINYDTEHNSRFSASNVQEWSNYLGDLANATEVDFLLNKASSGYIDSAITDAVSGFSVSPPATYNLGIIGMGKNAKVKSFFRYLAHAKACESFAVKEYEYWDYEKKEPGISNENDRLYTEMDKAFTDSKDDFIRQRYWFQLVRYNYYFNAPAAIILFEKYKNSFAKNNIYYRAMACAAGAFYKRKSFAKANYYYSLVFSGNDKLKTVAHWSFHPQEETDWKQTLALCANNEERIILWQMLGIFYKDEIRSMQEIYKLDPKSKKMDVLLTRFVNKNENDYSWLTETKGSREKIKAALPWLKEVADKGNTSNPFLWNTSVGYLYFLSENAAAAEVYYKKAGSQLPNTPLASSQLRLLSLLNSVGALKGIKSPDEDRLLPELKWLYGQSENNAVSNFRYYEAQRWIKETVAKKYKLQNDPVKAECFVSTPGFYGNDMNIEKLKALLTKSNPTPYEQFCASMSEKKPEGLWSFQAIREAYNDNIDAAIEKMGKAGEEANLVLAGNPFNARINDCHDCDHMAVQKIKYSKLFFLQKLKEMKDNITRGKDVYNNAVLLGNAFYNMSHYGNARYFYESAVVGSGHYSPFSIDSVFMPLLTDNSIARKYYSLALEKATDNEQKAKCHYLLAKCERNNWYNRNYYNNRENEYKYDDHVYTDLKAFDGLSQYSQTQYYREVLKECGYFRIYVKKKK